MKKTVLLLSFSLLVGCDDPTGGGQLAITKHENRKTASRGYVNPNGKGSDPVEVVPFPESGAKPVEVVFLPESGAKKEGGKGSDTIEITIFHKNGANKEVFRVVDGQREGVGTLWHENGQKSSEGSWKRSKKEGVWTYWDKQGTVLKTETYKNGELVK